jgi:hypothetical protein
VTGTVHGYTADQLVDAITAALHDRELTAVPGLLRMLAVADPRLAQQALDTIHLGLTLGRLGDRPQLAREEPSAVETTTGTASQPWVADESTIPQPTPGVWLPRDEAEAVAWLLLETGIGYTVEERDDGLFRVDWAPDPHVPVLGGNRRRLTAFNRAEMALWCGGREPRDDRSAVLYVGPQHDGGFTVPLGSIVERTSPTDFRLLLRYELAQDVETGDVPEQEA